MLGSWSAGRLRFGCGGSWIVGVVDRGGQIRDDFKGGGGRVRDSESSVGGRWREVQRVRTTGVQRV